ncbi:MAG: farnesyl diphosphate synthase [Nitrospinota bacterium]|nr:farnesyl diphosphate synthase [Nitrospinota bacterium]
MSSSFDVLDYMSKWSRRVNDKLNLLFSEEGSEPSELYEIMAYSLLNGGKRIRPILCIAGCEAVQGDTEVLLTAACAIECVHSYSLIHDDLPAMDDDDLRRGKPTSHKAFGEASAILSGDGLLTKAFELMSSNAMKEKFEMERLIDSILLLSSAAGPSGMVGGQYLDIKSNSIKMNPEFLRQMHLLKTSELIRASVCIGGILGGANGEQLEALSNFGRHIGLAFQIVDDILDYDGDENLLGKTVGSDLASGKTTYLSHYGIEKSRDMANSTLEESLDFLKIFGKDAETLKSLAKFMVCRSL